jgi:hypothetical protein
LWQKLGIQRAPDGTITFNDKAPQASIREAITGPMK